VAGASPSGIAGAASTPAAILGTHHRHDGTSVRARWWRCSRWYAIADYLFQYRTWFERQKMSLQEMKEEFKQSEGDPHIKARSGSCASSG